MRRKRQWNELSDSQQRAIIGGGIAEIVITSFALVDLARRPAAEVRGTKAGWALSFVVQPFGPLGYLAFGRRRAA